MLVQFKVSCVCACVYVCLSARVCELVLRGFLHFYDLLHHLHDADSPNRVAPAHSTVKNSERFAFMGSALGMFGPPIKMQQEFGTESTQVQTEGVTE